MRTYVVAPFHRLRLGFRIRSAYGPTWVCFGLCGLFALGNGACTSAENKPTAATVAPLDAAAGDGNTPDGGEGGGITAPPDPGVPVEVSHRAEALTQLNEELSSVENWNAAQLLAAYPTGFEPSLGFDPTQALNFDVIQNSALALDAEQTELFKRNGFVIVSDPSFGYFAYGYHRIYVADVPVFVTADSVLDAVHRSYDTLLESLEGALLIPTLEAYLQGMRRAAQANEQLPLAMRQDADLFLAVTEQLLSGESVPAGLAEDSKTIDAYVRAAERAEGIRAVNFLGTGREIDFTQFKPRGHYADSELLSRYFRAMMWLGRTDLRLIETLPEGGSVLRRRQVEAALTLAELMGEAERKHWTLIDNVVGAFVGEHDYMTVLQVSDLLSALDIQSVTELGEISDDRLAQAIVDGNFGAQRIASQVAQRTNLFGAGLPFDSSFALFGQRYGADSHVFSQVVYDRTANRVVPNSLDVAFAALGNNQAVQLLEPELEAFNYANNLAGMRRLIDGYPARNWESSLYTLWLGALRELSATTTPAGTGAAHAVDSAALDTAAPDAGAPAGDAPASAAGALPSVATTEAWGRRLLNTQLASWAQLRHDTLLYSKMSYTAGSECDYPDAYIDPYPEFWSKLALFADRGMELLSSLETSDTQAAYVIEQAMDYFERFSSTMARLQRMAEHQLTGLPHSAEDLEFIEQAVVVSDSGSGDISLEGWYAQLLYRPSGFDSVENVVADVHTDIGGDFPFPRDASVLHVGTSFPRMMVMSVDTCSGPRAYAGPVFAYKEHLQEGLVRLTDEEWNTLLESEAAPPDPAWLQSLTAE